MEGIDGIVHVIEKGAGQTNQQRLSFPVTMHVHSTQQY